MTGKKKNGGACVIHFWSESLNHIILTAFLGFFINRKLRQKVQNLGGIQLLTPLTKRPTAFQQHPPSIDGFYGCVHFLGGMTET